MISGSSFSSTVCAKRFILASVAGLQARHILVVRSNLQAIKADSVSAEHLVPLLIADVTQHFVNRLPHLPVARGQKAHGPVASIHHAIPSEGFDGMVYVRREVGRLPFMMVRFGHHA